MSETPETETAADDPEALRKDIADERKEAVRDAGQRAQETVSAQASRLDPRLLVVAVIVLLLLVLRRRRR